MQLQGPLIKSRLRKINQRFSRTRIHFNQETSETTTVDCDCELTGQDGYVALVDNNGAEHMTLTCKIEPADYRRAVWLAMRPRRVFAVLIAVWLVIALSAFAWALYTLLTCGEELTTVLFLGVALSFLALYFFLFLPRRLCRLYEQQKLLHGEFTAEISDEHLVFRTAYGESKIPWSVFHKWKSARDIVLVYHSDLMVSVFPARWFASASDFQAFQDILSKHLGPQRP